jgi:hypothetical protein
MWHGKKYWYAILPVSSDSISFTDYYPMSALSRVVGIDSSEPMLHQARTRAQALDTNWRVMGKDVRKLEFMNGTSSSSLFFSFFFFVAVTVSVGLVLVLVLVFGFGFGFGFGFSFGFGFEFGFGFGYGFVFCMDLCMDLA